MPRKKAIVRNPVPEDKNEPTPIPAKKKRTSRAKITFANLESRHCRWPMGDPRDLKKFHFCGKKVIIGESYCMEHIKIAYHNISGRPISGRKSQPSQKRIGRKSKKSVQWSSKYLLEDA